MWVAYGTRPTKPPWRRFQPRDSLDSLKHWPITTPSSTSTSSTDIPESSPRSSTTTGEWIYSAPILSYCPNDHPNDSAEERNCNKTQSHWINEPETLFHLFQCRDKSSSQPYLVGRSPRTVSLCGKNLNWIRGWTASGRSAALPFPVTSSVNRPLRRRGGREWITGSSSFSISVTCLQISRWISKFKSVQEQQHQKLSSFLTDLPPTYLTKSSNGWVSA